MASKPAARVALMMTERGGVPSRNAVARRMRLRLFSSLSAVTSASDTEACHERDNAAAAHSVTRCCSCSRSAVILAI